MSQTIMEVLLEIKGNVGELKGTTKALSDNLVTHIAETVQIKKDVIDLQLTQASERGARRTWVAVGSGIGVLVGAAAEAVAGYFGHR